MPFMEGISPGLIVGIIIISLAFIIFVIMAVIRGQKRKLTAGAETMIGKTVVAQTPLNPKGTVLAEGELWTARSKDGNMEIGDEATIIKMEGLQLLVAQKTGEEKEK